MSPGPTRKLKVLHIEDSLVDQKLAKGLYDQAGIDATIVGDIAKALAHLREQRFDYVVTDIMLPSSVDAKTGMNVSPVELLKLVEEKSPDTRRVIHSGIEDDELPSGFDFLPKHDPSQFIAFTQRISQEWESEIKLERQTPIDVNRLMRPIHHETASGKREMVKVINSFSKNEKALIMLRQGWRPMSQDEAARRLEQAAKHPDAPELMNPEELKATGLGRVDERLKRNAEAMRRKMKNR